MGFKSRISRDIGKVFLNNDKFGEEVTIESKKVTVVIDEDALKERNLALIKDGKLHVDDVLFYVEKDFFKARVPSPESRMRFNENLYMVTSVKDDLGMLTITLQKYGGR